MLCISISTMICWNIETQIPLSTTPIILFSMKSDIPQFTFFLLFSFLNESILIPAYISSEFFPK